MYRFDGKNITVTGGKGFLGKHLVDKLRSFPFKNIMIADLPEYNLIDRNDIQRMYEEHKPDVVVHLAAKVGGIGFNQENPASLFYENAMMGIQLMHEGYLHKIEKFVALGTICAYPKFTPVPFHEDDIWNGYPEETNAPYGIAKKMMLVQSQAYRQQYGFNSIFLLPVNLYGPHDNFNFRSSHVIPALIRKFHLAKLLSQNDFNAIIKDFQLNKDSETKIRNSSITLSKNSSVDDILTALKYHGVSRRKDTDAELGTRNPESVVEIWGTGSATREFFYAEDAADAIVAATRYYDKSYPVNIGAGFEISIKDLAALLADLMNFNGVIWWDTSKPDGQPRRMLDTTLAQKEFNFSARTSFEAGLMKTIEWYTAGRG